MSQDSHTTIHFISLTFLLVWSALAWLSFSSFLRRWLAVSQVIKGQAILAILTLHPSMVLHAKQCNQLSTMTFTCVAVVSASSSTFSSFGIKTKKKRQHWISGPPMRPIYLAFSQRRKTVSLFKSRTKEIASATCFSIIRHAFDFRIMCHDMCLFSQNIGNSGTTTAAGFKS